MLSLFSDTPSYSPLDDQAYHLFNSHSTNFFIPTRESLNTYKARLPAAELDLSWLLYVSPSKDDIFILSYQSLYHSEIQLDTLISTHISNLYKSPSTCWIRNSTCAFAGPPSWACVLYDPTVRLYWTISCFSTPEIVLRVACSSWTQFLFHATFGPDRSGA